MEEEVEWEVRGEVPPTYIGYGNTITFNTLQSIPIDYRRSQAFHQAVLTTGHVNQAYLNKFILADCACSNITSSVSMLHCTVEFHITSLIIRVIS